MMDYYEIMFYLCSEYFCNWMLVGCNIFYYYDNGILNRMEVNYDWN